MKRFFSNWKVLVYIILTLYAVITLIPFLWALSASFKPLSEIVNGKPNFLPKNFTLDNYKQLFLQEPLFFRWLFNSVIIGISVTTLNLLFNSMAGYALARLHFTGKNFWFFVLDLSPLSHLGEGEGEGQGSGNIPKSFLNWCNAKFLYRKYHTSVIEKISDIMSA